MLEKIICAGFGGQGVLLMGQLLAQAGLLEGRNVTWLPSYGPEMRGGTANCSVIISDQKVASPIVNRSTALLAMNRPSFDKFEKSIAPAGRLLVNSSIIDSRSCRDDIEAYYIPCSDIALELGEPKVANIVMLGAFVAISGCVTGESLIDALGRKLGEHKSHLIPVNQEAMRRGAAAAYGK
ncbi:MAG: 2-oxoacid:ferredoxin oxidoreductase subunit gamma [Clostridia bacterium]|nr:2-oxoacid:ferredoxin oxidoreductase subunit gamma [Clostridia bacterium]